jgi:hypothetical protein
VTWHRIVGAAAVTALLVVAAAAVVVAVPDLEDPSARDGSATAVVAPPVAPVVSTGMTRSAPVRLLVPSINVDASFVDLSLDADGALEVPADGGPAGWYTGGPTPGELGPAVIAGHVDWAGRPGVFMDLTDLEPGDGIEVRRADGSVVTFGVTRVASFGKDEFPTNDVYGNLDRPGLRLVTCGGDFDTAVGHYEDNVIVFADLVNA